MKSDSIWLVGTASLLVGCGGAPAVQSSEPPSTAETSEPSEVAATPEEATSESSSEGPAVPAPSGKVAACTTDASCNADPAISALWGTCDTTTGKCSCRDGAELDPVSQRCNPVQP